VVSSVIIAMGILPPPLNVTSLQRTPLQNYLCGIECLLMGTEGFLRCCKNAMLHGANQKGRR
jgi:hypothetical protein